MPIKLRNDEPVRHGVTVPAHGTQTMTLEFENPTDDDSLFLVVVHRVPPADDGTTAG